MGTNRAELSGGCFGLCRNVDVVPNGRCSGIGCCQTSIPDRLLYYNTTLHSLTRHSDVWHFNECGYCFLVEEGRFEFGGAAHLSTSYLDFAKRIESTMPVVVDWVIAPSESCATEVNSCKGNSSCYDVDGGGYRCKCNSGYEGNPYLDPGCQGVCVSIGVFFLVAISYVLYKVIKRTKKQRLRKRFFKRNGGLLLKQQEESDPSLVDKTIIFTTHELEKATDNFNENRILGRGGQGTVYKGMLVDGRIVAVKKSSIVDESQLGQFINEVVVLSQVNHKNVVKLLGCCLETDVPMLISEFIPNGTLYDCLHGEANGFPFSLNMILQIATEVAGALAYLHSATSIPIYHGDIKTSNILLDHKYRAKVSDFGTSRFVSIDKTHLTTSVKGTAGYIDPEYFQSSQFTEKSDVYSFGVVLIELLTREKPISLTRFGENRSLATYFVLAMEEGHVMSILDALVVKEGTRDEILALANLAMRCLNLKRRYRPTMKEVAMKLESIRTSHIPSTVQTNIKPILYGEEYLSLSPYGESSSTFLSFNDSNSG
ncbi:wall-associated receptor kinase-like 2 [Helianthus annuus]|uniref:wall-associated receptor kinase-like 2 n=1 Tax=Helianthus annuus TaxID=4232 RepID=UPI000B904F64|nr:wall-associated receptor kinase-like 2 [Helianthus annuus]